jgi:competence protein ComEC
MVLAIALLFCSFILPLAKLIGLTLSATIKLLNSSTKFIENLPLSTIEPISLNSVESLLLHCALVLILIFIVTKNKKLAPAILFTFILALGFRDFRFIKHKNTSSITVFNVPKKSALSAIQNGNLVLYSDSSLYSDKKAVNYLTSNIMADEFVSNISLSKFETLNKKDNAYLEKDILKYLICMDSLKVLYLMEDYSQLKCKNKLKVNYIILSKNAIMDIEPLQTLFDFEMLIADASVPKWKQEVLKRDCQQLEIPFYNVSESGAFICQIQK